MKTNKDIRTQYDGYAEDFSINQQKQNQTSRTFMYQFVGTDLSSKKVLDLACGDGIDAEHYRNIGADVIGIDASKELIEIAKSKYPNNFFDVGFAENLPYPDNSFDAIYSKYAIMTSADMQPIFDEVYRTLKTGGEFIYLVTHPFRQFIERQDLSADYFKQTSVKSHILDNTVTVIEPTHTMNEYFNSDFFSKFELLDFEEVYDPAAESIRAARYPGFFIVKARKK
jgi:ubiquinone/menaquinone biosynthesis C-methylase UbiE